jgi:hypothetical protein
MWPLLQFGSFSDATENGDETDDGNPVLTSINALEK